MPGYPVLTASVKGGELQGKKRGIGCFPPEVLGREEAPPTKRKKQTWETWWDSAEWLRKGAKPEKEFFVLSAPDG